MKKFLLFVVLPVVIAVTQWHRIPEETASNILLLLGGAILLVISTTIVFGFLMGVNKSVYEYQKKVYKDAIIEARREMGDK